MISIKNKEQIECMRKAGQILFMVLTEIEKAAKPGVKTAKLDTLAESIIRDHGATPSFKGYRGFPYTICSSVNDVVVHGFPGEYVLREGDIYSVDAGVYKDDYHADSARTIAIGEISAEARRLIEVTERSFYEGMKMAREGNRVSDVSHAVQVYAESQGYSVVRDLCGHGIGKNLHEDPEVPNFGSPGRGVRLRAGMTIAIEPMINQGVYHVMFGDDGWKVSTMDGKLSAHYEHTVLVTEGMPEILTAPQGFLEEKFHEAAN